MKKQKFIWGQFGGLPECPYFRRWVFPIGKYSVRVHNWLGTDDTRAMHDHEHWLLIVVLRGGYTDVSRNGNETEDTREKLRIGSIRFRPAEYRHYVDEPLKNTWTLVITGPSKRRWGFWKNGKLIKRDKYFAEHGHHPCHPNEPAVRLRPDGSRI